MTNDEGGGAGRWARWWAVPPRLDRGWAWGWAIVGLGLVLTRGASLVTGWPPRGWDAVEDPGLLLGGAGVLLLGLGSLWPETGSWPSGHGLRAASLVAGTLMLVVIVVGLVVYLLGRP